MFLTTKNILKYTGLLLLCFGLIVIYKFNDPSITHFFPSCPFHSLTGLLCPGCGSQRAVHHLLNLRFSAAFEQNQLLVVSIPYIVTGLAIDHIPNPSAKIISLRNALFGWKAILFLLVIVICYWIFRNIL